MSPLLRNVFALIAGIIVGGVINSALIAVSPSLIRGDARLQPV